MSKHTKEYKEILQPEQRIPKGRISPRNIYRISTYRGGDPATKTGDEARYVFVIGIVDDKLHCLKLNDIKPLDFTNLLFRMRDKRQPVRDVNTLSDLLKTYSGTGEDLFEREIKKDKKVYLPKVSYRIYKLDKIVNVWEIQFERDFLLKLFKEGTSETLRRKIIKDEVNETNG